MIPRPPDLNVGSRARALQVLTCDPSLQHLPTRVNIETGGYRGGTLPLLKIGQDFFPSTVALSRRLCHALHNVSLSKSWHR